MKKTLLILSFIGLSILNPLFSQQNSFVYNGKNIPLSEKLISHFTPAYLETLKSKSPNHILYLNYLVENSYRIQNIGEKATENHYQHMSDL
jgi:hypothetical protein